MDDKEWHDLIDEVGEQTELMVRNVKNLDFTADSQLPGWDRARVVAHVIGNARGLGRLARWANDGIERPMYPSVEARNADIELRAQWTQPELVLALGQSSMELQHELELLDETGRERIVKRNAQMSFPGRALGALRLQEVAIHHSDLGIEEYTYRDWPEQMTGQMWRAMAKEYQTRDDAPVGFIELTDGERATFNDGNVGVKGSTNAALAWLLGRSDGSDLEVIGADELPAVPNWR